MDIFVMQIALDIFRTEYGIACDPEHYPVLWDECIRKARQLACEGC